jgi:hypothetical protein
MNDIDRLIGVAKSFREATTDAAPTEGSIIGLWMATASALESTTARLREAEACLEEASAAIGSVNEWDGHGRADQLDNTRRILSRYKTTKTENGSTPKRRLRSCVEQWPECETGDYDPACCRFPKSCSATVYDDDKVTDADLEPVTDRENGSAEL